MTGAVWAKVCSNCGHYKPVPKRRPRPSFDDLLALPDDSKLKTASDRASFHYFSDNGVWKKLQIAVDTYRDAARAAGVNKYPFYLHRSCYDYVSENLYKEVSKKRASKWKTNHYITDMQNSLKRVTETLKSDYNKETQS